MKNIEHIENLIERTQDLIDSNSDFICSDCINTIQFLIHELEELGVDTEDLKNQFNNLFFEIY